jgi:hypothetical protein
MAELARSSPGRFCGVGGHSPALWLTAGETAPGAFDDAEDFARHDLVAAARKGRPFGRTPLWLDTGDSDPFLTADREFARLIHVPLYVSAGGHNRSYWHRHTPDYLRFYAAALASC